MKPVRSVAMILLFVCAILKIGNASASSWEPVRRDELEMTGERDAPGAVIDYQ